jgi:hypothetical protein
VASAVVDWSDMSGSSSSSPPRATEVSSLRRPQVAACEKHAGSSLRPAACPAREDSRAVRPRVVPSGMGTTEVQRAPPRPADRPRLFDGSIRPDLDSLQRRRSRARSTDSASTPSALQEADSGYLTIFHFYLWSINPTHIHSSPMGGKFVATHPHIVATG